MHAVIGKGENGQLTLKKIAIQDPNADQEGTCAKSGARGKIEDCEKYFLPGCEEPQCKKLCFLIM